MPTAFERKQDFVHRMSELGIVSEYTLIPINEEQHTDAEARFEIQVIEPISKDVARFHLICHALMGMIAHFQNRKWAKDWSYMFIMKSMHRVTFTNESDE